MSDRILITIQKGDESTLEYRVHPDVMNVVKEMLDAFERRDPLDRELSEEELSKGAAMRRREKDQM